MLYNNNNNKEAHHYNTRMTNAALKIKKKVCVNFEVPAVMAIKIAIFCNVTPCDLV